MNAETLQVVVDRAKFRMENDKKVWYLSDDDAKEFVRCVDKYVKKSVFRSDVYDPEDAYSEVLLELWRCLTKYGPRPSGKLFGEYVLPLKTNNVLTNRANKRKSLKSRVNYLTSPIDTSIMNSVSVLPFDIMQAKESAEEMRDQLEDQRLIKCLLKKTQKETLKLSRTNFNAFISLFLDFALEASPKLITLLREKVGTPNKFENLTAILYNKGREICLEVNMKELKIGDKLITPGGKIIEIRRKTDNGYVVYIPLIDQETEVEVEYTDRCTIFDTPEDEKATQRTSSTEETKQLKVYAKKIVEEEQKSLDHIEVNESESGAATKVIVELLKAGPQTRDFLARALVNKGLSKSNDVEKAKGYVSVLISNLKKTASFQITSPKRGTYELVV